MPATLTFLTSKGLLGLGITSQGSFLLGWQVPLASKMVGAPSSGTSCSGQVCSLGPSLDGQPGPHTPSIGCSCIGWNSNTPTAPSLCGNTACPHSIGAPHSGVCGPRHTLSPAQGSNTLGSAAAALSAAPMNLTPAVSLVGAGMAFTASHTPPDSSRPSAMGLGSFMGLGLCSTVACHMGVAPSPCGILHARVSGGSGTRVEGEDEKI